MSQGLTERDDTARSDGRRGSAY